MMVLYILGALLAFSILIIGHEFGHFMLAKINGVKVEEFSLGMGPKLFGIKGKETEYLIKVLPIGGYVKMLGEEGESNDKRAFINKSASQKLSIVAAGPIMNLILAFILMIILGSINGPLIPQISSFTNDSAAMQAGMKVGDEIVKINNNNIENWNDCVDEINKSKGQQLTIDVMRNREIETLTIIPKLSDDNRYVIGIYPTEGTYTFTQLIKYGFSETGNMIKLIFKSFAMLFNGEAGLSDLGGPVTIIRFSVKTASMGIANLIFFTAFLSVNLGIMNIIPFPALDGGWIIMLLIELITGKKLDDNKVGTINYIGFMILMTIMVLVTVKDIIAPVKF